MRKQPIEQRKDRLLADCYERILSDHRLTEDLDLLDALQDVTFSPPGGEFDWFITKKGEINFK